MIKITLALVSIGSLFIVFPKEVPTEWRVFAAVLGAFSLILLLPDIVEGMKYFFGYILGVEKGHISPSWYARLSPAAKNRFMGDSIYLFLTSGSAVIFFIASLVWEKNSPSDYFFCVLCFVVVVGIVPSQLIPLIAIVRSGYAPCEFPGHPHYPC